MEPFSGVDPKQLGSSQLPLSPPVHSGPGVFPPPPKKKKKRPPKIDPPLENFQGTTNFLQGSTTPRSARSIPPGPRSLHSRGSPAPGSEPSPGPRGVHHGLGGVPPLLRPRPGRERADRRGGGRRFFFFSPPRFSEAGVPWEKKRGVSKARKGETRWFVFLSSVSSRDEFD